MSSTQVSKTIIDQSAILPSAFLKAHEQNAAIMTRVNEIVATMVRAIWESQVDLYRLEVDQPMKVIQSAQGADQPISAITIYCDQWHEGSERLLNHIRSVNDLTRVCAWDLFDIYRQSVLDACKIVGPLSTRN